MQFREVHYKNINATTNKAVIPTASLLMYGKVGNTYIKVFIFF